MQDTKKLDYNFVSIDKNIKCPNCGEETGMHHLGVEVSSREKEDSERAAVYTIRSGCEVSDNSLNKTLPTRIVSEKDMPGRRDFVSIAFMCEHCQGPFYLNFVQHKGMTKVYWTLNPVV